MYEDHDWLEQLMTVPFLVAIPTLLFLWWNNRQLKKLAKEVKRVKQEFDDEKFNS